MLKKFIGWFIVFGLSFLVSDVFHWTEEQGKAFLILHLSWVIIAAILLCALGMSAPCKEMIVVVICALLKLAIMVGCVLFATWGATKIFDIDFFVAYQVMTFGQCLISESNKNEKQTQYNNQPQRKKSL